MEYILKGIFGPNTLLYDGIVMAQTNRPGA